MWEFFEAAFESLEGWNSTNRNERVLARISGCIFFVLLCIVLIVLYMILRR